MAGTTGPVKTPRRDLGRSSSTSRLVPWDPQITVKKKGAWWQGLHAEGGRCGSKGSLHVAEIRLLMLMLMLMLLLSSIVVLAAT